MEVIKVDNLDYTIDTLQILSDVSFSVYNGEIFTIIGPSGSGKSTLLKMFNRLIDQSKGSIFIQGEDIKSINVLTLRKKVSMVFQRPILFSGTVAENICYGPSLSGKTTPEMAKELLALVGLHETFLTKDSATLSGGEAQRVAVARALANKPDILLMDEPTSALDPTAVEQIEHLIKDLNQKLNLTILLVTHAMNQAQRLGSRTMLLVDGKVVEVAETAKLFSQPENDLTQRFIEGKMHLETQEEAR